MCGMSEVQLLVVWFVIPAPIILLWVFLTNREYPIKDKLCSLLISELFGVVSAIFIVLIWVDMLVEKVEKFVPDNFKRIAKGHNIGDAQNGGEVEMKPGDKVWVFDDFDALIIREVTIISVVYKKRQRPKYSFNFSDDKRGSGVYWSYNVFPSRQALCEHYRKIFE